MAIAPKRMYLLIWNFLTFHKYQKQKFWSLFKLPPCLLPPSSLAPWKRREFKKSSYDLAPKIWFFLLVKSGLHAKDESCSFKIGNFCTPRCHEISISPNVEILKFCSKDYLLTMSCHSPTTPAWGSDWITTFPGVGMSGVGEGNNLN